MLHEPAAKVERDPSSPYKMRIGVWMFIVYSLIYAGFIAINVASPLAMEREVFAGLNLAVVYGFGLIFFAFVQALVYDRMCAAREAARERAPEGEGR